MMDGNERECPECNSKNIEILSATETFDGTVCMFKCRDCEARFQYLIK